MLRSIVHSFVSSSVMSHLVTFFVFLFKQKTAYELRISDWSSDVGSSDLAVGGIGIHVVGGIDDADAIATFGRRLGKTVDHRAHVLHHDVAAPAVGLLVIAALDGDQVGMAGVSDTAEQDRKSVV